MLSAARASACRALGRWMQTSAAAGAAGGEARSSGGAGQSPFPERPWFVRALRVSDALKNEMHELHVSAPETWTVLRLASRYQLKVPRVKAILSLKAIEAAGQYPNEVLEETRKLDARMEDVFRVRQTGREADVHRDKRVGGPDFVALSDDDAVAAAVASRQPPFRPPPPADPDAGKPAAAAAPLPVLDVNPAAADRAFDIEVIEIGSHVDDDSRTVTIRKKDGSLVEADASTRAAANKLVNPQFDPHAYHKRTQGRLYRDINLSAASAQSAAAAAVASKAAPASESAAKDE
ncbi:uncharacterized protein AMSG_07661 [Thecamonas trahens ATCC 50062]|uniref:Uncharacterized protein n=1 Tax=Thecamonas trahens ATCC 50062 TaxID=461836 RepID=A0A0L0DGX1_THETB|nr:hypothetical protein AMSG_07661 [Thecamonas trahens ATCC 50062]KNC51465.1 hypothetical protein AMSG_07661 [Thecamonas trahens ATCC 50062]|eukprot:XP_013756127.1 hypothetical protein AMSG_07661 [Thecamonas trahens ATCC 50062]